jgi:acetyltransferase-like isoleucine patch superfamily enzyme
MKKDFLAVERRIRGLAYQGYYKANNLRIGRNLIIESAKRVVLGNDVTLYGSMILSAGNTQGFIRIGDKTHIDRNAVLYGQGGLTIGQGCAIAAGVIIYTQTNSYDLGLAVPILEQGTRYKEVVVGNDVWIGAGAIILPGVTIGDHAVIGAGAVVCNDIPPAKVAVGVPARPIKSRAGLL